MSATATREARTSMPPPETLGTDAPRIHKLYLALRSRPPLSRLDWWVHLLGLDIWGTQMLERARREMRFGALILMLIFVFDFSAWGLFFNQILQGGILKVGRFTVVAIILGCGMAMFFFLYERAVMTFDTSQGNRRLYNAMMLRSIVILVGGALTTQPIELLLFKESINRRIRDESIRHEVVIKWKDFNDLKERDKNNSVPGVDGNRTSDLKAATRRARGDWDRARRSTQGALNALASTSSNLTNTDPKLRKTLEDFQTANARVGVAREQEANFLTILLDAQKQEGDNEKENQRLFQQRVTDPLKRIKAGLDKIRQLDLDTHELKIDDDWTFKDIKYDFIQQLRVLADLRYNISPDWPDATPDERADREQQFDLKYDWNSHQSESRLYFVAWCLVFAFSFIVPLMSFLYKILLPRELADYYSSAFQRSLGNPEARAYEEARKQAERERELVFDESSALS